MLFNSIDFAIFLPIVFILYWFVTNHNLKLQNVLILTSSYLFYGWWDWRFLSLILFSTLVDFYVGQQLGKENNPSKRKVLLWMSILVNLGFLGFFKYYNFFIDNFNSAFSFFGTEINTNSLNIILPVGISFYTFQTLSYTIDIYRRKLKPTKNFIAFSAFVSFFPQLVAGPIERASHLLPQFYAKRKFDDAKTLSNYSKSNTIYNSLAYDAYGAVKLDNQDFNKTPARWNGVAIRKDFIETKQYTFLDSIATFCSAQNIKLIYVQGPFREGYYSKMKKEERHLLNTHIKTIETLLSTKNATFINTLKNTWEDALFVDYTHLNKKGSKRYTGYFLSKLK